MSANEQVLVVDHALRGMLLADYLEREIHGVRRSSLRGLIQSGAVRVNGEVVVSARRLRAGDVIELRGRPVPRKAPEESPGVSILFESPTALVVDKPEGVPASAVRTDDEQRLVHRIDRSASGCLLLARGLAASRHFESLRRAGGVRRRYVVLVEGVVDSERFEIDAWLGPDPRRPGMVVAGETPRRGFREARTEVAVQRRFGRHSLLELRPGDERGHQLRVHLASRGHPIVGDGDYGGRPLLLSDFKRGYKPRRGFDERPLVARPFAHAVGIAFSDVDGRDVAVTAPMPEDLCSALDKLEHFSPGR